jgi:hypothetical protein
MTDLKTLLDELQKGADTKIGRETFNSSHKADSLRRMIEDWRRSDNWEGMIRHMWRAHELNHLLFRQREILQTRENAVLVDKDRLTSALAREKAAGKAAEMKANDTDAQRAAAKRHLIRAHGSVKVSDVAMSVRLFNCLKNMQIDTLEDAAALSDMAFLVQPNFGRISLNELRGLIDVYRSGEAAVQDLQEKSKKPLSDRDIRVMAMKADGATYEEIGKDIGVTRERVRQILAKALIGIRENTSKIPDGAPITDEQVKAVCELRLYRTAGRKFDG